MTNQEQIKWERVIIREYKEGVKVTKQEEIRQRIREGIIILKMSMDELITIEEAAWFWGLWKEELERNPEHFGDCTKEPQACNRCLVESYYSDADKFIACLHAQGGVIRVDRELPDSFMDKIEEILDRWALRPLYAKELVQTELGKAGCGFFEPLIKEDNNE